MEKTLLKLIIFALCSFSLFADQSVTVTGTGGVLVFPVATKFASANGLALSSTIAAAVASGTSSSFSGMIGIQQVTGLSSGLTTGTSALTLAQSNSNALVSSSNSLQTSLNTLTVNTTATNATIIALIPTDNNQIANGAGYQTASGTVATISGTIPISKVGNLPSLLATGTAALTLAQSNSNALVSASAAIVAQIPAGGGIYSGTSTAPGLSLGASGTTLVLSGTPISISGSNTTISQIVGLSSTLAAISSGTGGGGGIADGISTTPGMSLTKSGTNLVLSGTPSYGDSYIYTQDGLHYNDTSTLTDGPNLFTGGTFTATSGTDTVKITGTGITLNNLTVGDIVDGTSNAPGMVLEKSGQSLVLSGTPTFGGGTEFIYNDDGLVYNSGATLTNGSNLFTSGTFTATSGTSHFVITGTGATLNGIPIEGVTWPLVSPGGEISIGDDSGTVVRLNLDGSAYLYGGNVIFGDNSAYSTAMLAVDELLPLIICNVPTVFASTFGSSTGGSFFQPIGGLAGENAIRCPDIFQTNGAGLAFFNQAASPIGEIEETGDINFAGDIVTNGNSLATLFNGYGGFVLLASSLQGMGGTFTYDGGMWHDTATDTAVGSNNFQHFINNAGFHGDITDTETVNGNVFGNTSGIYFNANGLANTALEAMQDEDGESIEATYLRQDAFASGSTTLQSQITANTNSISALPVRRSGSYSGTGTATTSFVVTIGVTMANTNYKVNSIEPTNILSGALQYISAKTTTTFTVTYMTGLTGAVAFDWGLDP